MQPPPNPRQFHRYPVISGTIILAIVATLAWWGQFDATRMMETIDIRRGQLWRLITSAFLHVNFIHLAFNAYWVWVFGTRLEGVWGHVRTLATFLVLALGSSAAEFALHEGGVGLSGVGYGLFGLMWVLSRRDSRFGGIVDAQTIQLFIVWFFICIATTIMGIMAVGNIAHGAGAVMGILMGMAVTGARLRRAIWSGAVVGFLGLSLAGATIARPYVNLSSTRGDDEARLGYAALMENRDADALRWYLDAVRAQPANASHWYNLGIAYDRLKRHEDARGAFKRAFDLEPGNSPFKETWEAVKETH